MIKRYKNKTKISSYCPKKDDKVPKINNEIEYIQKDIDLEVINSYRNKYTGMSYTEIPNIRIDIYNELNKMFIVSNKNKLYLEITPIDKIKDEGFRIEKVRILGTCIYMLVYKFGENEKHKNTIIKKGINITSLIFNNRTGCIEKII